MPGLFGSPKAPQAAQPKAAAGMQVQTSVYGNAIPIIWGTNRVAGNLIWYGDFQAVPQYSNTPDAGKGGGGSGSGSSIASYLYFAAWAMAICEGPIEGYGRIWRNKELFHPESTPASTLQAVVNEAHVVPNTESALETVFVQFSSELDAGETITVADEDFVPLTDVSPADPADETEYKHDGSGTFSFHPDARGIYVYISYSYQRSAAAAGALGFTEFTGTYPQSAWSYLTTNHADEALNYHGVAYVAASSYRLLDSADLPQHNFEVLGRVVYDAEGGVLDANPADVVYDFLTNANYGTLFPSASVGDLTAYSDYCLAAGIVLSPILDTTGPARDFIGELLNITNSAPVWSDGVLKILPYGDEALTGIDGTTYTPDLTPAYDLTDEDYLVDSDEDPVECERVDPADAYNQFTLEFVDRANDYTPVVIDAKDQAAIDQYGLRPAPTIKAHAITQVSVARLVLQLLLQRELYVGRNRYRFKLSVKYSRLEPMDLVTLTETRQGLDRQLVRITETDEGGEDGDIAVVAEELPVGVASAATYGSQANAGYIPDYNADPGDVNKPVMFTAPYQLVNGRLELWMGLSGGENFGGCEIWISDDDATYRYFDAFFGQSRLGRTTSAMAIEADPDEVTTLGVNLAISRGVLTTASEDDADNYNTLCWVAGELLSYADADLTSQYQYDLTYLRRGAYNSTVVAAPAGSEFLRLDDSLYRHEFPRDWNGRTLYFKFLAFNRFSGAKQSLDGVRTYSTALSQVFASLPVIPNVSGLALEGGGTSFTGRDAKFVWDKPAVSTLVAPYTKDYRVEIWDDPPGGSPLRTEYTRENFYVYTYEKNFEDHAGSPERSLTIKVLGRGEFSTQVSATDASLTVDNPVPGLPSGVALDATFDSLAFDLRPPNETDWDGTLIWTGTSTGFTPSGTTQGGGNCVYRGRDSRVVISPLAAGTYYLRYASIDTFPSAIGDLTISGELSVNVSGVADLRPYIAGSILLANADKLLIYSDTIEGPEYYNTFKRSGSDATMFLLKEIRVPRSGTLTISFDLYRPTSGFCQAQIFLAGSPPTAVGTFQSDSTADTWVTFTEDIAVSAGDGVQLWGAAEEGGAIRRLRLKCGFFVAEVVNMNEPAHGSITPPPYDGGGGGGD